MMNARLADTIMVIALMAAAGVQGQALSELTGDNIVSAMQTFGDKCPPTTPNGQNWAPLPADTPCGSVKRCDFPNQWCAFKIGADGNPDLGTLNCQALSADCKKAFQDTASASTGGTGATGGTTPSGGTPTPGGSPTTPPGGSQGTTPGGSTPGMETSGTPGAGDSPTPGGMPETTAGAGETSPTPSMGGPETSQPPSAATEGPTGMTPPQEPGMGGGNGTEPDTGTPSAPVPTEAPPTGNGTSGAPSGECCDYHEFCCFWASTGQCESNKPFMVQICQKSCGSCGCSGDPNSCAVNVPSSCAAGSNAPPGTACPCKSGHLVHKDWNEKCSMWASRGDCDKNSQYMKAMCKSSCNVCQ